MAQFEIILTREVTISITVPAKDADAAQEKALEYANDHISNEASEFGNPRPAREWEHTESSDWTFVEAHDA